MIPFIQIVILALVQGITEFLPISSSAHLIIIPNIFGWQDQGVEIDVAVHFGTLCAVILYFWRDVWAMIKGTYDLAKGTYTPGGALALKIILATIPVIIIGAIVSYFGQSVLRTLPIIAGSSIFFGIILYIADRWTTTSRQISDLKYWESFLVGVAQCFAIIPGTSRAGACITALRFLGIEREEAARYSSLMSIPTILAAATLIGFKLLKSGNIDLCFEAFWAAGISLIISFISIWFMMWWVRSSTYTIFIFYRIVLGIGLLVWVFWNF